MSFPKNDRNFQSGTGKTLPIAGPAAFDGVTFQEAIAEALRRDFGGSTAAVKRVARMVGANERAVRNWFDAKNGPRGEHLVELMRHSGALVETVLTLSGQGGLLKAKMVSNAAERLGEILMLISELTES